MGQIYLVRHGQASFGNGNYDQLSSLGTEQARLLGAWFAHCKLSIDRVVTGGMQRHRQTASACLCMLPASLQERMDTQTDAGFAEYDHAEILARHQTALNDPGALQDLYAATPEAGRAFKKFFADAMARWMSGLHDAEYRESWPAFRHRCVSALQRLVSQADQAAGTVVFTSGGTIAVLCQYLLGLNDAQVMPLNFTLVNSAVSKLLYRSQSAGSGNVSLNYLNNYAHLELQGEPELITYR